MEMNLLNVLKVLNEGENYLIKIDNYNKIGCEVKDNFNLFERKEVPVPTPFELIGNENRINLSVSNKVYGQVKLNPIQAKKVGLPTVINGPKTYNTKTIIKDGALNVNNMDLIVDMKTYITLKNGNVEFTQSENKTSYPGFVINLDLTKLSLATTKTNFTMDEIVKNMETIFELKAKQRVLNALIAKLPKEASDEFAGFTEEQCELLKEHGLDKDLNYIGVDTEVVKKETYTSQILEFKLKGSSMSSFSVVLKRVADNKSLNKLDVVQYDFYNKVNVDMTAIGITTDEMKRDYLKGELKKIKSQLFNLRLRNVMIKLELDNSPIKEIALEDDNSTFTYNNLKIQFVNKDFEK